MTNELMTRKQVKDFLGICFNTLYKLDIPAIRIGRSIRYQKSVVEAWLQNQTTQSVKNVEGGRNDKATSKHI